MIKLNQKEENILKRLFEEYNGDDKGRVHWEYTKEDKKNENIIDDKIAKSLYEKGFFFSIPSVYFGSCDVILTDDVIKYSIQKKKGITVEIDNALWSCFSSFRQFGFNSNFYYELYKEYRKEFGVEENREIESEYNEFCSVDVYFETFKGYFYEREIEEKVKMIDILLNFHLNASIDIILSELQEVYGDFDSIPEEVTFDCFEYCTSFNSFGLSFVDIDSIIRKVNQSIIDINKILGKTSVDLVLENKIGLKELPDKVINFVRKYKFIQNINEENIVIVKKTNDYVYSNVINPVISLTRDKEFETANEEYLRGLDSYNKGNYADCVNAICSSLESTMKIICSKKGYNFTGQEQLKTLTEILFKNGFFDFFTDTQKDNLKIVFEKGIGFIRNSATAHGNGTIPKKIEEHTAKYVINMGGTLILYLINIYEDM